MRIKGLHWGSGLTLAICLSLACSEEDPLYSGADAGTAPEGADCTRSADCHAGLVCTGAGVCKTHTTGAPGQKKTGEACASHADCLRDYTCSFEKSAVGVCVLPGSTKKGETCKGHHECAQGLLCSNLGTCASPGDSGTKSVGDSCTGEKSCASPLVCVGGMCLAPSYWKGASCEAVNTGVPRALFRVPRVGATVKEFYSLPFPNNIRLKGGKVDLTGHPDPKGSLPDPFGTVVTSLLGAVQKDVQGFGLNTTVFMRTSTGVNFNSLVLQDATTPSNVTLRFINIDKASAGYGDGVAYNMFVTTGRGSYICNNYLTIRPSLRYGVQLRPKTTYAVILRQGIKDPLGNNMAADDDFKAVIGDTEPTDADLKAAHTAYAPLRTFLKDKGATLGLSASTLISATVFTTMDPYRRMAKLRQQIIDKATAPTAGNLTLCDGKTASPCADGKTETHKCPTKISADFHELHGTFQTAVLQGGTPPFKSEAEGGAISYDKDGKPEINTASKQAKLCYALTVPKKVTMPKDGWPAVIYAHGTGGHFRSFVGDGTAATLAKVTDPADSTKEAGFVVISTDGAMHGPRRNTSAPSETLFFNVLNPRAARDNIYQGAADKHQLVRLAKAIQLAAGKSPTGGELKIDPKRIYFFGQSQGTVTGIPVVPFEPDIKGAVLGGAGGYLLASLLAKTKPVNIAGIIKLALADPSLGTGHPLLNLMQLFFEEVDAVNYGRPYFVKPETGQLPRHVLLSYGVADSYTPPGTIQALAWAMGLHQVKQDAQRCGDALCTGSETCQTCEKDCDKCMSGTPCGNGVCETASGEHCRNCPGDCKVGGTTCKPEFLQADPPVRANIFSGKSKITAGVVKYSSDGTYDDHFVISKNKDARAQSSYFLGSAVWDSEGVPTIPKKVSK